MLRTPPPAVPAPEASSAVGDPRTTRTAAAPQRVSDPVIQSLVGEATAVAERLLAAYPQDPAACCVAANIRYQLGDTDEALALWERCLALAPQFPDAQLGIGSVRVERGEYRQAEAVLRSVVAAAPDSEQALVLLATALLNQGKLRETAALLEPRAGTTSGSMPCVLLLGQAYLQLKEYERAKPYFEQAVRLAPDYPNARYGLAMSCARLGQAAESSQHMKRFKELESTRLAQRIDGAKRFDDQATVRKATVAACLAAADVHASRGSASDAEQLRRQAARYEKQP